MKIVVRLFWIITLALGLSACATQTTSTRYPSPVVDRSPPPAETFPRTESAPMAPPVSSTATPTMSSGGPAVIALLERADQQYINQDLDAAAASLERALRIEPRNPLLWHRLASIRLDQGQIDQAMQMAAKSNSLAGNNHSLSARNWQLISLAYRAKGDLEAARSAEDKARQFE